MTDELKYDPELPFALVRTKADGEGYPLGVVEARTRLRDDANDLADTYQGGWVKVIDTTPKPKIPEDAEYITWSDPYDNGEERIAMRYGHPANKVWRVGVDTLEEVEFLEMIGDAEVTVLVRKEDS